MVKPADPGKIVGREAELSTLGGLVAGLSGRRHGVAQSCYPEQARLRPGRFRWALRMAALLGIEFGAGELAPSQVSHWRSWRRYCRTRLPTG